MSALVWATESAILGLWAVVFSLYSNAFHAFVARSHALISAFTLLMHLAAAARDWPIGHSVSEAFVCAVCGLLLVYVTVLFDPGNFATFFTMPVVGFLPLDGCLGLGWFTAALVSALGMALSERGRRTSLMFHHFGYHMLVVPPSFLLLWLYDYSGSASEPVSAVIGLLQAVAHTLFFMVWAVAWGMFIFLQFAGESIMALEKPWPRSFSELKDADFWLYLFVPSVFKLLGRAMPILASVSAAFVAPTAQQTILMWVLVGIAAANSLDFLQLCGWLVRTVSRLLADIGPRRFRPASDAPSSEETLAPQEHALKLDLSQPRPPAAVQMNTDIFRIPNAVFPAGGRESAPRWRDKMV